MISIETALNILKTNISPSDKSEIKSVLQAVNQILLKDISSPVDMPPFTQSVLDGHAVCLHDELNYHVIDKVKAGDNHKPELHSKNRSMITIDS